MTAPGDTTGSSGSVLFGRMTNQNNTSRSHIAYGHDNPSWFIQNGIYKQAILYEAPHWQALSIFHLLAQQLVFPRLRLIRASGIKRGNGLQLVAGSGKIFRHDIRNSVGQAP